MYICHRYGSLCNEHGERVCISTNKDGKLLVDSIVFGIAPFKV